MDKPKTKIVVTALLLSTGSFANAGTNNTYDKLFSGKGVISGQAHGGHESVDALKAEIAGLKDQLNSSNTGREYLLTRLQQALADEKNAESGENAELQRAMKGREFLSAQSKRNRIKLMAERKENARISLALERALRGRAYLKEKLVASQAALEQDQKKSASSALALERALRGRAYLKEKSLAAQAILEQEQKKSARSALALERALRGRAYLKEKSLASQAMLEQEQKKSARTSLALERALRGRAYVKEQSLATQAALEKDLTSAVAGRDFLKIRAQELIAQVKAAESEADQLAEVSFAQINSAMAEASKAKQMLTSTAWADDWSAGLTTDLSDLDGTEVTSRANNSVSIKVGNTGLFRLGGTALSGDGQQLLGRIGAAIAARGDSNIKIVGHTDNIPTGSGSRFASNDELSLARASSALSFMTSTGIPAERLSASGVGDAYPIASNDTEEGQLANRRVEIVLTQMRK